MTQPKIQSDQTDTAVNTVQLSVGTYNIAATEDVLIVDASDGDVTLNLHSVADSRSHSLNIKRVDDSENIVTVIGAGNPVELIDGSVSTTIVGQYTNLTITPDITNDQWWII